MTDILRDALNACFFQTPLPSDDERRVDFHELGVRGTDHDPIDRLKTVIDTSDVPKQQLFSGFIGSGKSTELIRLAGILERDGYIPLYIDSEEYLNLRVSPSVNDLLATVAAGVDKFIQEKGQKGIVKGFKSYWERIYGFLGAEVQIEGINLAIPMAGELELKLKQDVSFKAKLYEYLEQNGRLLDLTRQCQSFLTEAIAILKKAFPDSQGLVIILDSFEKVRGDQRNAEQIRGAVENIFVRDWKWLQLPCHVIYTVPSWLTFIECGATAEFGKVCILPMCRLADRETNKPEKKGYDAMRQILEKRMDLSKIFTGLEPLDNIIAASGGYPRDFLRMMHEVILFAIMDKIAPPIPVSDLEQLVKKVIAEQVAAYEKPVYDEDVPLLVEVARTHDVPRKKRDQVFRLAELFDNHFVLGYRNGEEWYDLHPLVKRGSKVAKALKEADGKRAKRRS